MKVFHNQPIYALILIIFLVFSLNWQTAKASSNPGLDSFINILPQFLQNFIKNVTNFSTEKIEPGLEKSGIEQIISNPTNTSEQNSFFTRVKNWLQGLSQEINQFFKLDIGSAFSKIMNLMIYWFNKGVEFIKNLFS
jgi:hypothetical protein